MKKWKVALIALACLLAVAVAGCGAYVSDYYRADETAVQAAAVARQWHGGTVFMPAEPTAGFIFYPGGKVEHTAYAPLMKRLSDAGILCVLAEMPFNLAVLDVNAAEGVPEAYPQVDRWYIGGHSLGGSMAASYAADHAGEFAGVALLAAYSTADLAGLPVISIYGTEDEVLNMEKYLEYRENLSDDAVEQVIEGGCHAYFGSYGPQEGDGAPTISAEEQLQITADALLAFFEGSDAQ